MTAVLARSMSYPPATCLHTGCQAAVGLTTLSFSVLESWAEVFGIRLRGLGIERLGLGRGITILAHNSSVAVAAMLNTKAACSAHRPPPVSLKRMRPKS